MADEKEGPEIKLARKAVETYIKTRKVLENFEAVPDELLTKRAGAFVCLKIGETLRGCIGTTSPIRENLAEEIVFNAISSATKDPRFPPVDELELLLLDYTVDILEEPEPIPDESYLDPKKYGVIVESGYKSGLLLPDLEGIDTVKYQVSIAKQKAGIYPDEPTKFYRFKVRRCK